MIKIAFFDIDGTLLRFRHNDLSEPVRSGVKTVTEAGDSFMYGNGKKLPIYTAL